MLKTILFSDGASKEMTFEEVRKQFMPLIIKVMKQANNKFIYNQVEEEDFRQILEIELWRGYEQYDPSTKNCFTTYLYPKLKKGVRNATYHRYALKNQGTTISMNSGIGDDDLKLEDLLSTDDTSMDNIAFNELLDIIRKNVDEDEKDALRVLLDRKEFSVQDYANKYGITRQAANQRVVKLRKKLQKVISEQYLEII